MRTNIDIDDELMQRAMAVSQSTTKKAAVETALRLMIQVRDQGDALKDLWGIATWSGPDDDWFAPDPLDPNWKPTRVQAGALSKDGRKGERIPEHGSR